MKDIQVSKFLSLILRHQPEIIKLKLDNQGWANVDELIDAANRHGKIFNRIQLEKVVETNDKQRFSFNEDKTKIRAAQGHSFFVNLELEPREPPSILFHGTAKRFVDSIKEKGLNSGNRQYVHLSRDVKTALAVGKRHGTPIVLSIKAEMMWRSHFEFYLSQNGIWLVEYVPSEFIDFPI